MRSLALLASCPFVLTAAVSLPIIPAHAQKASPVKPDAKATLAGTYQGKLVISPAASLTIVFRLAGSANTPTATMDVIEQGAKGLPVKETVISGDRVVFRIPDFGITFSGKRSADGKTITGTFAQGGGSLPLTLIRMTGKIVAPARPQTPKPPFPYRTEEVSFSNPKASGVTLAGTLSLPQGVGPFPVALFITGSGPQDRDSTIMEHKPFAVIADYLTRRGIACLRVDDRGVGKSTGNAANATSADFAEDTRAGMEFLKGRKEIDSKQIGLIGHSEGGLIGPMVAANNPDVAFLVILAGPGVPGREIILEQQKALVKSMGGPETAIATNQRFSKAVITILDTEKDIKAAQAKVKTYLAKEAEAVPAAQREAVIKRLEAAYLPWCQPWFVYFLTMDPAPVLQSVPCPVLALNGSLDLQVLPKQNLAPLEAALKKGSKDVTALEIPELNHLFQHAKTGSTMEYATITETFAPEALTIIGDWIATRIKIAMP
jgi:pimeloyl-ACP methyl ester carboxylesterase